MRKFKESEIRDLLIQVSNGRISFSRFVEIINERINYQKQLKIFKEDDLKNYAKKEAFEVYKDLLKKERKIN